MKKVIVLLWVSFLVGLIIGCQEITPLTPPNPIMGKWGLFAWQVFHLPAWYATKTREEYLIITATDTIYGGPPVQLFNVTSLTFSPDGSFSEQYLQNGGLAELSMDKFDSGRWTLADSVVNMTVMNDYPHKLTYRATTDQLITDIHPKTSVIRLGDGSINTVSYSIRIYYKRSP